MSGARTFAAGPLGLDLDGGAIRRVTFRGTEVVRLVDAPIRDADWRTLPVEETGTEVAETAAGVTLHRRFRTTCGRVDGEIIAEVTASRLTLGLTLTAREALDANRAGFVLLHPIRGVAGAPLTVTHPDGRVEATRFPRLISPGQPVFDIAALRHRVGDAEVAIAFEGEVFEMEDQRNWTDASFKTYCRPLGRPRPFRVAAGDTVRQRITIDVAPAPAAPAAVAPAAPASAAPVTATRAVRLPEILLAHEPALGGRRSPGLAEIPFAGLALRVDAAAPVFERPIDAPVTLEIVADTAADIASVAAAARAAGIAPRRVVALPRGYLASHQPEGPWPEPRPADFLPAVRAAFPGAEVGGGALTNFTELNRCRPDPAAIDFLTFGTTAIVHAGDDRSVLKTLEALDDVLASAAALAPGKPLHLGLVGIPTRSNPYGGAVAPNPDGRRIAMAMDDPRHREDFAAAWAVAAIAAAARAGVASLAPAMAAGPIRLGDDDGPWPLRAVVAALAGLGGGEAEISGGPGGLVRVAGPGRAILANLGPTPVAGDGLALAPLATEVIDIP